MISVSDLSEFFVEVADTLVDDFDLLDFLDNLTHRAAVVSGASAVGLVLSDRPGRVRFMAASNESGKMLELLQIQNEQGPCLDCLTTGEPVVNADLAHASDRWPTFAPHAIRAGFQSVHAFPMRLRTQVVGALNLFGSQDSRFQPDEIRVVQALADVATIAMLQERNLARAETLTEQLQGALNSRVVIEQAKGALAAADRITTEEAFELMRSRARSGRRRLVDVAHDVLAMLEKPGR
ncbi:GAF and ANTAR domain-containing protein [Nocardioides lianchengensis]|uniref:ANTAR domain-containing protein n=1 Tax=Nocardioides lianchengensis TaxID=1045774 RepID=A0A1G6YXS5_9ACTN|nr:GAF and ANTAR domain-containing protein [Nocardioides lianchengensis]NYG09513.1 GAF domain-containing protein [Nocardioides lianchengensis]SDD94445.1 ANTAR domain-containing protein [Nocardioides lianchengensis]